MPTHRQQSFLGTLWLRNYPVSTLDVIAGEPVWINTLGGAGILPGLVSTVRNDSSMLSCHPSVNCAPMVFYFRHTSEGYRLYVRETGDHFGKGVVVHDHKHLGVQQTDRYDPSLFTLKGPDGRALELSELTSDFHSVMLIHGESGISRSRRSNSTYEYLAAKDQAPHIWLLRILERNVPWLSSPDEV